MTVCSRSKATDYAPKTTCETILSGVSFLLYTKSKVGGALVERTGGRAATAGCDLPYGNRQLPSLR
jgi:hypothetical protein